MLRTPLTIDNRFEFQIENKNNSGRVRSITYSCVMEQGYIDRIKVMYAIDWLKQT